MIKASRIAVVEAAIISICVVFRIEGSVGFFVVRSEGLHVV